MELRNPGAADWSGDVLRFLTEHLLNGTRRRLLIIFFKQADFVFLAVAHPGEIEFLTILYYRRFLNFFDLRTDNPAFAFHVGNLIPVHLALAAGCKGHDLRIDWQS